MNRQEPKIFRTAVEAALEAIGGKWKPVILFHLTFGMKRNGQLLRLIPDITQKVLTQQLRELQDAGIVRRISYDEIPPRVEYELTGFGRTLEPLLHSMCLWGESYISEAYGETAVVLHSPDSQDDDGGL
ncbi:MULTISPECIES: helix-turn-helix domain-containing protein [unclassified Paenibacillus]|uniref:winged helix-turn-helix transcriptional regulator n=1 Tax=unclassified Paenibacillus TaxID=185978 RepID=UPI00095705E4|nr:MULTISPECIES: helix-turn-helix domain-containing protein [unclassified Paenibacillus]ASS69121.1 helix-turn-helix transcriptional regulator [Paenibacillus sp. RUD330]SIQ35214.1 transcriptional regulator, HxlR family [Paenibacillus sp. RU4X]SIQ57094.1 transcriptional regulator, HxlR family [Paenibacillus sp. RU4T]